MPSYEDVTQRAGSLRAMTGLTEPEFTARLPHFEHALAAYLQDHTIPAPSRSRGPTGILQRQEEVSHDQKPPRDR